MTALTVIGTAGVGATLGAVSGNTALGVTAATLVSIQVDPADSVISMDITVEFTATGIYSDNSTQDLTQKVTWRSSDDRAASISNADDSRGLATPIGFGSPTFTRYWATSGAARPSRFPRQAWSLSR